ncbi:hypothetical protein [Mycolicibacterium sp. XJ1819]
MEWAELGMAIAGCAVLAIIVAAWVSDRGDIMRPTVPPWQVIGAFFAMLIGSSAACAAAIVYL